MKPLYTLKVNDTPIDLSGRLISLELLDKPGLESDTLALSIDDSQGRIELPRKGVTINCSLGLGAQAITGDFIVDTVTHTGPPALIEITARAADFSSGWLAQKERSYQSTTLGNIVDSIAGNYSLTPAISEDLSAQAVDHIDQTNESDAHFITRIAKRFGAMAAIKQGHLLFLTKNARSTASGKTLPTLVIDASAIANHSYESSDRQGRITGVSAAWQDYASGKKHTVVAGNKGYVHALKTIYSNEQEAQAAASAKLRELTSLGQQLNVELTELNPNLLTGLPVKIRGVKPEIDSTEWVVEEITHSLSESGLVSRFNARSVGATESIEYAPSPTAAASIEADASTETTTSAGYTPNQAEQIEQLGERVLTAEQNQAQVNEDLALQLANQASATAQAIESVTAQIAGIELGDQHQHDNLDLLDELNDAQGQLVYKQQRINDDDLRALEADQHRHSNSTVLNQISERDGQLIYRDEPIAAQRKSRAQSLVADDETYIYYAHEYTDESWHIRRQPKEGAAGVQGVAQGSAGFVADLAFYQSQEYA